MSGEKVAFARAACGLAEPQEDMTLRDYFAASTIGHMFAVLINEPQSRAEIDRKNEWNKVLPILAAQAYALADAMLEARDK